MTKFKKGFIKSVEEELKFEAEQQELKKKHGIEEDENVVVVEKDDKVKFAIRLLVSFVKLVLTIIIVLLAVLGVFALCYENTKTPLLENLMMVKEQIMSVI